MNNLIEPLASGVLSQPLVAVTTDNGWELGIGDPTLGGWMTVIAYFVAAYFCWKCARLARRESPKYFTDVWFFWFIFAVVLTALGINKQLDLQTLFTDIGKSVAQAQGWYEKRRYVQFAFIIFIALAGVAVFLGFCWLSRRLVQREWLALGGGVFLICFILIRAASFHHFDQLIGKRFLGFKVNWILELGGIACIGLGAWRRLKVLGAARSRSLPESSRPSVRV